MAVAEAYNAMTSKHQYREAMSPEAAHADMVFFVGTQFYPELVDVFCKTMEQTLSKGLKIK